MPKPRKTAPGESSRIGRNADTGEIVTRKMTGGAFGEKASPKSRAGIEEGSATHRDALKRLVDR